MTAVAVIFLAWALVGVLRVGLDTMRDCERCHLRRSEVTVVELGRSRRVCRECLP